MEPAQIAHLIEQMADKDWRRVGDAERQLLALGTAGMDALIAGMSHPNPMVRRRCAGAMDHHGDDRCVVGLSERFLTDDVAYVRREAVHALGCDRCKSNPLAADRIPLLIRVIQTDPSIKVRREATFGLCQMTPDPRAMAEARRILTEENDKLMCDHAHRALYQHDPEYRERTIQRARARQGELQKAGDKRMATT